MMMILYFWSIDETQTRTSTMMTMNRNLVCAIFRTLEGVGSQDITNNLFIPFGSPAVMKSDESKFNHKAKVTIKE